MAFRLEMEMLLLKHFRVYNLSHKTACEQGECGKRRLVIINRGHAKKENVSNFTKNV
jgi:hypothetical protein